MALKRQSDKIRAMHIVNTLGIGGMETVLVKMLKLFDRSRFETYVCCLGPGGELVDELERAGIEVFFISKNSRWDFFKIFKIADLLAEKNIDVLHSYSGVYRDGAVAARLARVPVILHTDQGRLYPDSWLTKLYHRLATKFFRQQVIAVSDDLKGYLIKSVGIKPAKIAVIPNGIVEHEVAGFDRAAYRKSLGLPAGAPVFGIVARLAPVKDHSTLLEASKKVFDVIPAARLLVVGDGQLRGELKKKAEELGIAGKVSFLGKRRDIPEILSCMDLFVLSSKHEGISLSVLEAMASGLAVVATHVGGNSEIVLNGETGLLVTPAAPADLADAIIGLLKDGPKRLDFGLRGKKRALENFSLASIVRRYESLYMSHIDAGSKIRVMHLASNPEWAGAEVHLAKLAESLSKDSRIEVSVCVFHEGKLVDYLRERGIEVNVIKLKFLFDISAIFKTAGLLRRKKIDILHTHGYKANVIGALARLISRKAVCVRTEHGMVEPFTGLGRLKMNFYCFLDLAAGRFLTKKIISVSSEIGQHAEAKYSRGKVGVIHNGIDAMPAQRRGNGKLRGEFGIDSGDVVIGTVGRLAPVKGHKYFIDAAKKITEKRHDVRFLIAGDGPLKASLETRVSEEGMSPYFVFTGFRDDIQEVMGIIDIVVFPSLSEGIPYALLEAMAVGKPVVATRVGGLAEVIIDGQNGLLAEIANEKEIAERCLYLLENQNVMNDLGENAKKTIKENFSAKSMKEETIRVYEESLAI